MLDPAFHIMADEELCPCPCSLWKNDFLMIDVFGLVYYETVKTSFKLYYSTNQITGFVTLNLWVWKANSLGELSLH